MLSNFFSFISHIFIVISAYSDIESSLHWICALFEEGQTTFDKSCRCYSTLSTSFRLFNNRHLFNTQCLQGYEVDNPPRNTYVFVKYSRLAFLPLHLGTAEKNCCLFAGSRMFHFAEVRTFFNIYRRNLSCDVFSGQEQYKSVKSLFWNHNQTK